MTVELKEFVERSLKDVLKAVHDAGEDPQIGKQVAPWGIGGAKFPETSGVVSEPSPQSRPTLQKAVAALRLPSYQ